MFLAALAGVTDPEEKRKIIGREFIRAFERATREIAAEAGAHGEAVEFLVQGTLYPDVVESGGGSGTASIKSHHNVGGLPEDLGFQLVEPLRGLFKDEVRRIGQELGLPPQIVWRQPFPGPGLGIRIVGEITEERLQILREADAIVREELSLAGLDADIWQCPVVLLADIRSVGVQGDFRTYGHPVVLRPVTSEDAMTADWARLPDALLATISTRITNEVRQINRVVRGHHEQASRHHRVGVAAQLRHGLPAGARTASAGTLEISSPWPPRGRVASGAAGDPADDVGGVPDVGEAAGDRRRPQPEPVRGPEVADHPGLDERLVEPDGLRVAQAYVRAAARGVTRRGEAEAERDQPGVRELDQVAGEPHSLVPQRPDARLGQQADALRTRQRSR